MGSTGRARGWPVSTGADEAGGGRSLKGTEPGRRRERERGWIMEEGETRDATNSNELMDTITTENTHRVREQEAWKGVWVDFPVRLARPVLVKKRPGSRDGER